jgi:hypothetical protein
MTYTMYLIEITIISDQVISERMPKILIKLRGMAWGP